jgi:hypothetical protein
LGYAWLLFGEFSVSVSAVVFMTVSLLLAVDGSTEAEAELLKSWLPLFS